MELVKASKMHLYLVSFGRYLRYQCGGICWKRGESSFVGWVVGSSLTLSYVRISGFPHWMPGSLGFPTISVVLLKVRKSRSQHRHQSIFWSFSAVWALLWTGKNPVYHRFLSLRFQGKDFGRIQLLQTSIWHCDETTTVNRWEMITGIYCVVRLCLTRFKG